MNPYTIPGLKSPKMNFERIINTVLNSTGKTENQIRSKKRTRDVAELRMICMWAIRNNTNATWEAIGKYFYRHHSTAIHAHNTITHLIEVKDESVLNIMERIKVFL